MKSKRKLDKVQKSKEYFAKERAKVLDKVGYNALKEKHGSSKRPDFPDYHVDSKYQLSNNIDVNGLRKSRGSDHKDAINFPVGNSHKQGLELIYSKNFVADMNGKKT
jgi:hypothetical protein